MFLTHKDHKDIKEEKKNPPNVKNKIRAFVGKGKKSYEEIVNHIQKKKGINITGDDIIAQVEELSKTKDFDGSEEV